MARVREVQGDLDGALDLLHEADRLYEGDFSPNVRPVPAITARMLVRQGRLAEAMDWVRERGLSAEDDLTYLHEYEHITLTRILLARYRSERDDRILGQALELLARLLKAADDGGRTGNVIEILALTALAHDARGELACALDPLERSLSLAEPEGYVRLFADEGAPMARLLTEAVSRGIMPRYAARLVSAIDAGSPSPQPPAGALSERELEVLRLIAQGLTNQEIADRLFLALDTVKGHNRRLFAKLDVQRRTEALLRARELGLLER